MFVQISCRQISSNEKKKCQNDSLFQQKDHRASRSFQLMQLLFKSLRWKKKVIIKLRCFLCTTQCIHLYKWNLKLSFNHPCCGELFFVHRSKMTIRIMLCFQCNDYNNFCFVKNLFVTLEPDRITKELILFSENLSCILHTNWIPFIIHNKRQKLYDG